MAVIESIPCTVSKKRSNISHNYFGNFDFVLLIKYYKMNTERKLNGNFNYIAASLINKEKIMTLKKHAKDTLKILFINRICCGYGKQANGINAQQFRNTHKHVVQKGRV